jgi:hypothetical protein
VLPWYNQTNASSSWPIASQPREGEPNADPLHEPAGERSAESSSMTERAGRRVWMLALGVIVILGALAAAVAMWIAGSNREADNVAGFARAPVGCDTTLDFESTGTFLLYVETSGRFGEIAGGCDAPPRYDRDADDVPVVQVTLRDPSGDVIELDESGAVDYDVDGFVGTSIGEVQIDAEGDHVLTVESVGGEPFAVAVGRQPDQGVTLLRWGALAAVIGGLLLGGLLLVLGSRRPPVVPAPATPWTPDGGGWPSSPPGFPVPPPTTGATGPVGPPTTPPPPIGPSSPPAPAPPAPGSPTPQGPPPSPWGPPPTQ